MTLADITTRVYFLTKTNSSSYANADLLISLNKAIERCVSLIMKADSRWQFDDTNQTDLPIATATITSGQQDYQLATSHLTIDRVEVKDSAGNWTALSQIDQQELKGSEQIALAEYQSTTGVPVEYDVVGGSIFLYPTPNYTQASSLKVYFTRPPVAYVLTADLTDSTKVPGFNSLFHDLIPMHIAFDYAVVNGMQSANGYLANIQRMEQELNDFYGLRNRDYRGRLTASRESNR